MYCEGKKNREASCLHNIPHCLFFQNANGFTFMEELENHPEEFQKFNEYINKKDKEKNENSN